MGLCTPASCTDGDIQHELNEHIQKEVNGKNQYNLTYEVKVVPDTCQSNREDETLNAADITFWYDHSIWSFG